MLFFKFSETNQNHRHRDDKRQGVGDRAGGEDAVDAHEFRQNDEKRDEEKSLSRQRNQQPLFRVVGG